MIEESNCACIDTYYLEGNSCEKCKNSRCQTCSNSTDDCGKYIYI